MNKLHSNLRYKRFECKLYKKSFNSSIYNKSKETFCPFCGSLHKAKGDSHKQITNNKNKNKILKVCSICNIPLRFNNKSMLCREHYLKNYWSRHEKHNR